MADDWYERQQQEQQRLEEQRREEQRRYEEQQRQQRAYEEQQREQQRRYEEQQREQQQRYEEQQRQQRQFEEKQREDTRTQDSVRAQARIDQARAPNGVVDQSGWTFASREAYDAERTAERKRAEEAARLDRVPTADDELEFIKAENDDSRVEENK